jgi:hypothetical protein
MAEHQVLQDDDQSPHIMRSICKRRMKIANKLIIFMLYGSLGCYKKNYKWLRM